MAKTSEDQFGKEGFKMAKKLKKYRKNQNLSISYQAVVIDFNWRLHHNNHNPPKKNINQHQNLMNDLLVQNRNPPSPSKLHTPNDFSPPPWPQKTGMGTRHMSTNTFASKSSQ